MDRSELEGLKEFATKRQAEYIDARVKYGSGAAAASALGVAKSTINRSIQSVRMKAAARGYAPSHDMVNPTPDGFRVKGTSTLYTYGDDGQKVAAQWVKTDRAKEQARELLEDWVAGLVDQLPAKPSAIPPPPADADLLPCFVLGDPHAGLYAWEDEAGENYNLDRWARDHRAAMARIADAAPLADQCVIVNLGDFFHADDHKSQTPGSGHGLDVDSRHAKVFREGCATFEHMIDTALAKYPRVTVYVTKGNHDPESSFALAEVLRAFYRNEERVDIRGGVAYREYHTFGENLIGITHGDKAKPPQLPAIMASEVPELWGASTCRRWFVGHFHHQDRKEYPGCMVEIFPTLAANDAWHTGMGYQSEKAMTCYVFHSEYGEVAKHVVGIRQL